MEDNMSFRRSKVSMVVVEQISAARQPLALRVWARSASYTFS